MTAWHWLLRYGLYKDVLATAVALTGARIVAWRPLREHRRRQERIADLLDTSTPGGLGDLDAALNRGAPRGDQP